MKGISILSVPGFLGLITLILLVIPKDWSERVVELIGYSSNLMVVYGLMMLLLIYVVLVKIKLLLTKLALFY